MLNLENLKNRIAYSPWLAGSIIKVTSPVDVKTP